MRHLALMPEGDSKRETPDQGHIPYITQLKKALLLQIREFLRPEGEMIARSQSCLMFTFAKTLWKLLIKCEQVALIWIFDFFKVNVVGGNPLHKT